MEKPDCNISAILIFQGAIKLQPILNIRLTLGVTNWSNFAPGKFNATGTQQCLN
jgi:hypothetical protein